MNKWAVATGTVVLAAAALIGTGKPCRGDGRWACPTTPTPVPTATATATVEPTSSPTPTPSPTPAPGPLPATMTLRESMWYESYYYPLRGSITQNDGRGCMGEDNGWERVWTGTLLPGESFTADLDFCGFDPPTYQFGSGLGFVFWTEGTTGYSVEPVTQYTYYGEVKTGTHFCVNGRSTVEYTALGQVFYPVTSSEKHPGLANGGRWTVTITGTGGPAVVRLWAFMTSWPWQVDYCPAVDRDIEPWADYSPQVCLDPRTPVLFAPDGQRLCRVDNLPNRPY